MVNPIKTMALRTAASALLTAVLGLAAFPAPVEAQYFGRNKVQYDRFDFRVLKTEHFDIHYYPEEAAAAAEVGRMAERWYARLSKSLNHTLVGRQPVILYASHPHFQQTNVVEGISEGTGGVTEGAKRRVILPMAASLADTDHVLGHELVHAFQYDILGPNAEGLPLWFIEGMAEYLSIGARDPQTAMWLRDAAIQDRLPKIDDLDNPRYFPYRFGHAFWAYVAGRWGDEIVGNLLAALAPREGMGRAGTGSVIELIEQATGRPVEELSAEWHAAILQTYGIAPAASREETAPDRSTIGERTGSGSVNVGPALSPDGTKIAFLSERDRLSIDLFLADATTGRVIRKLVETASDPHFESLQFLASAGAWDAQGQRLAIATIRGGRPVIALIDTGRGKITHEVTFPEFGEVFHPTWSPDGNAVAFAAQVGGFTDLFVHDLQSGATRRLTNDAFADLQPAWSPDGRRLAFVTDRFAADLGTLEFRGHGLALISLDGSAIAPIETGLAGNAINPQWSDSTTLFFVSDSGGRQNVWRLNLTARQATRVTDEITGVAGITPVSPALSVASGGTRAAISVFYDSGYEIRFIDGRRSAASVDPTRMADAALLPPVSRSSAVVNEFLRQPRVGLPGTGTFEEQKYRPRLSLIGIGQQVGVATNSQFGAYVSGGIALQFSDILGNHMLGTAFGVEGGARDASVSATYLNRTRRLNWGIFGERVPLLNGSVRSGFATVNGQRVFVEQADLFRQTYLQAGAMVAYPFSRSMRVEFSGASRRIGFDREIQTRLFDPVTGTLLDEQREDLPSDPSIQLFDVGAALVRDTSAFGATSPILGQRFRLEVAPSFGDLEMINLTADFRQYLMPFRPLTLAGRLVHVGRYGGSGEDQRLTPLFLGYSTLVRGYDVNSFEASECTVTLDGTCPEFDRLIGSRLIVANAEVRVPAVGLFTGRLDYGPLPVELLAFFDAGMAWTRSERPAFANGPRSWVTSVGVGARVNLFGFAIGEFNLARPLSRPTKGWLFIFNLRPGF